MATITEIAISGGVPPGTGTALAAALHVAAADGGPGPAQGEGESSVPPHIRGSVSYSLLAAALAASESGTPALLITAPPATEGPGPGAEPPGTEPPGTEPPGTEVPTDRATAIAVRISEVKEGGTVTVHVCTVSIGLPPVPRTQPRLYLSPLN